MHRRVAMAVVVLLGALLAWLIVRHLPVGTVDDTAGAVPVHLVVSAAMRPEPSARSDNPPAERAVKETAISALAAVSGRHAVVCPPLPDSDSSTSWTQPEGAICALTTGIVCAVSQPAGSVVVWRDDAPDEAVAAYRWDTGPDGSTICAIETPTETRVRLHVLDAQERPRAGVSVSSWDLNRSAITDAAGWATLLLPHDGVNWVIAIGDDGAVSSPMAVEAGGVATIVLGDRPADIYPGDVLAEVRMSRRTEAIDDLGAALESSTPEVERELSELLDSQLRALDSFCETSDVPTCREWRGAVRD